MNTTNFGFSADGLAGRALCALGAIPATLTARRRAATYFMRRGSYNHPVSKRRLWFAAALAVAAFLASAGPTAQAPTLEQVLAKAATYVGDFRRQLAEIVAEETYRQEIAH